jgi:predicted ATPase
MPESKEMMRLTKRWATGSGWPKRLEWIEISGLRGWQNQRLELKYPIMAIVGENGSGKSTVLQCIASIYKSKPQKELGRKRQPRKPIFASDFFPDTAWERITGAQIRYCVRQGGNPPMEKSLRKKDPRWRGYKERPSREVIFRDLSRIQTLPARVGYSRLAKPCWTEKRALDFDKKSLTRFSQIMGREYDLGKMSYTSADPHRPVPVIGHDGMQYSGFHQGAGETILAELVQTEIPPTSIVLIDEVESSLHPKLQRRLMRDLAELARQLELQIVLTTHSPIILDELPVDARAYIMLSGDTRSIVYGITPDFAMTKMDDVPRHECELYVEDERAERMLLEIIIAHATSPDCALRCRTTRYGASSVGKNLGIMAFQKRFRTPSFVFLDGDEGENPGCMNLPGPDAPEVVVFEAMRDKGWLNLKDRVKREFSAVADACLQAMMLPDPHEWVTYVANKLVLSTEVLWHAMCSEWATQCITRDDVKEIVQPIEDALDKVLTEFPPPPTSIVTTPRPESKKRQPIPSNPNDSLLPFGPSENLAKNG